MSGIPSTSSSLQYQHSPQFSDLSQRRNEPQREASLKSLSETEHIINQFILEKTELTKFIPANASGLFRRKIGIFVRNPLIKSDEELSQFFKNKQKDLTVRAIHSKFGLRKDEEAFYKWISEFFDQAENLDYQKLQGFVNGFSTALTRHRTAKKEDETKGKNKIELIESQSTAAAYEGASENRVLSMPGVRHSPSQDPNEPSTSNSNASLPSENTLEEPHWPQSDVIDEEVAIKFQLFEAQKNLISTSPSPPSFMEGVFTEDETSRGIEKEKKIESTYAESERPVEGVEGNLSGSPQREIICFIEASIEKKEENLNVDKEKQSEEERSSQEVYDQESDKPQSKHVSTLKWAESLFSEPKKENELVEETSSSSHQPQQETIQFIEDCFEEISEKLGIDIQEQIETAIEQQKQTFDEEFKEIKYTVQTIEAFQKGHINNQEEIKNLVLHETSYLNTEINHIQGILDNLNIWKEQLENRSSDLQRKQEENEKQLRQAEKKIGKKTDERISKAQLEMFGELKKQNEEIAELRKHEEGQRNLFDQKFRVYEKEKEDLEGHLKLLTDEQKTLKEKLQPLHDKYSKKDLIFKEQQTLKSDEKANAFYETLEKALGSKFYASILLTSGLLQRSSVKKDLIAEGTEYVVEGVFGFVAGMIAIGTFGTSTLIVGAAAAAAGTAVGKAARIYVGNQIDKKYEGRAEAISSTLNNPKHAWVVAELVARRVSQHYFADLCKNTLEENQKWAKEAANILYLFIASGKLKERNCTTENEMMKALIDFVEERIKIEINKKGSSSKRKCAIL